MNAVVTRTEILQRFPNAAESFIRLNTSDPNVPRGTYDSNPSLKTNGKIVKACKHCGKTFESFASAKRKFCSFSCAYADPERAWRPNKDYGSRVCKVCGKTFIVHSGAPSASMCSRTCAAAYGRKLPRRPQLRLRSPIRCAKCGKEFDIPYPSVKRIYCSSRCARDSVDRVSLSKKLRENGVYSYGYSRTKHGWREIGGKRCFFRSRMEANYARYLSFSGERWEYEPKTFWFDGIKRGVVSYTPDFFLPDKNVFLETKGWMDARSKTKLKRMAKYHPDVILRLIDWKSYRVICRQLSKVIPGWEKD